MKRGYSSMKKRILAVLHSLVMIFQMLPAGALADGGRTVYSANTLSFRSGANETIHISFEGITDGDIFVPAGNMIGVDAPITPAAPEGQVFIGWYCENANVWFSTQYTPDSDMVFTAKYGYTVTFDPNTEEGQQLAPITINVQAEAAIGDQLPEVPEVPGYNTYWVKEDTTEEVTAETIVTESFTAVVGKKKIEYTVTFVQEDGTEETRTTSIDDGFAVNGLPEVTPKTNKVGKWVYPGTTDEFTVGTVISENLTVNAHYEQNIYTVEYMVDGAHYDEMTTAAGMTILLPSEPIKAGATFLGWFTEPDGKGTQYTAESTVTEDLTLYAHFNNQVRVSFIVRDDEGEIISTKSQYFVDLTVGDKITTLPDDPFVEGKIFDHWENETNGDTVETGYTVTETFNAVAVFKTIETYEIKISYFYMIGSNRVDFGSQVYNVKKESFPYGITVPGFAIATEVETEVGE